jgi:hypothetical protein
LPEVPPALTWTPPSAGGETRTDAVLEFVVLCALSVTATFRLRSAGVKLGRS